MRKNLASLISLVMVGCALGFLMAGCSNEEEENFRKEVNEDIKLIENEVKAIEQHQEEADRLSRLEQEIKQIKKKLSA